MTPEERALERALDDAHAYVKHYRTVLSLIVTAFVVFVGGGVWGLVLGTVSVGTGIDLGGVAFATITASVVGGVSSWFTGMWWWELHNMRTRPWDRETESGGGREYAGPPTRHVRAAERAREDYRDALVSAA